MLAEKKRGPNDEVFATNGTYLKEPNKSFLQERYRNGREAFECECVTLESDYMLMNKHEFWLKHIVSHDPTNVLSIVLCIRNQV